MKKLAAFVSLSLWFSLPMNAQAARGEAFPVSAPFSAKILADGLDAPWEMLWGPDDMLWVTERQGKRITRVHPGTGEKSVAATIDDAFTGPQHEGILGMAFAPLRPDGEQQVFVAYTYKNDEGEYERVVRFRYEAGKGQLANRVTVLEGIPAGSDHNGGRLVFGPDGKLYLSKGELGHNQGANFCKPNDAQRLPTAEELKAGNYAAYAGKVLRLNPDGSVPADNPRLNGVRSHVFTYGHRNPQGLVWVGGNLFSSEQGPSSDDEINILVSGGNYGWPHVAGFRDDLSYRYANWSGAPECPRLRFDANVIPGQVPTSKESDWQGQNFREPAKTFYTVPESYEFSDARCAAMPYLCWPTIAPASVTHYPADGPVAAWRNSLLVTSLKNGTLYVLPLSGDQARIQGDVTTFFRSVNRYRVARVSPDGKTLFIAADSSGNLLGQDGRPTDKLANPGAIIRFDYTGE